MISTNKRITNALIRLHECAAGLCLCCSQTTEDRFSRRGPYEYILLFLPGWFAVGNRMETGSMTPTAPWRDEQLKQFVSITGKPRCFPCPDCDKSFPRKSELQRHYMIHTGVKPYKCQFCDQSFRQRPHIKRHLYVHHHEQLISGKVEISKLF